MSYIRNYDEGNDMMHANVRVYGNGYRVAVDEKGEYPRTFATIETAQEFCDYVNAIIAKQSYEVL